MASISQALQGAKIELAQQSSLIDKARLCSSYVGIIGQELVGTLTLAPYGYKTWRLHRDLPSPSFDNMVWASKNSSSVLLLRDQRYGQLERNNLDIYIPGRASGHGNGCQAEAGSPMAIFCHGGIWATGAKWQFAPLAASLAQRGIVTCVLQYSLYPQALVPQMVKEVADAVWWLSERCHEYGASSSRVSLVGHSAGAQLCFMAVLDLITRKGQSTEQTHFLPSQCIGMAGVYDIGSHYAYEQGRGVAYLSTMARAIGGESAFVSQSPALILGSLASNAATMPNTREPDARQNEVLKDMQQSGEQAGDSSLINSSLQKGRGDQTMNTADLKARQKVSECPLPLSLEDMCKLPTTVLMSSTSDITVPWSQSAQMHEAVQACGATSHHKEYDNVGHGDFVINWKYDEQKEGHLPEFAEDLVKILIADEKRPVGW